MTIAIGFLTASGILVATDRQYSFTTSDSSKRTDAEKITEVKFKNGYAVIAEAGDVLMSKTFVDLFERNAAETVITSRYTVPDLATEVMRAIKQDLCEHYGCTAGELNTRLNIEGTRAQCIIASVFGDEKFLHTIHLSKAITERVNQPYITIGSGGALAEYLLKRLYEPGKDHWHSSVLAAYIIKTVEDHDIHCGGRPNIVNLDTSGSGPDRLTYTSSLKPETVDGYLETVMRIDSEQTADMRRRFSLAVLEAVFKKHPEAGPQGGFTA